MNEPFAVVFGVSGVLFGFLFAAFWWTLNRELTFERYQRHFKIGTGLLVVTMALLGAFGLVLPLHRMAQVHPGMTWSYRGVVLALLGIFGYMLVELGHYSVYQKPKYVTKGERIVFWIVVTAAAILVAGWFYGR